MSAKSAFATTLDFSEHSLQGAAPSDIHYTGVTVIAAPRFAEPPPRNVSSVKRPAALKALREHRDLFTAEAVIDRAARLNNL